MLKKSGFTLIELLVVVAVIGILSGITISVINPKRARNVAYDGVKISNLQNLASSIEAYYAGEGSYPANGSGASVGQPAPSTLLSTYLSSWPGADYKYYKITEGTSDFFCVGAESSTATDGTTHYLKIVSPYHSTYTNGKPECAGVVIDCPTGGGCTSTGGMANDMSVGTVGCTVVATGASCK